MPLTGFIADRKRHPGQYFRVFWLTKFPTGIILQAKRSRHFAKFNFKYMIVTCNSFPVLGNYRHMLHTTSIISRKSTFCTGHRSGREITFDSAGFFYIFYFFPLIKQLICSKCLLNY